MVAISSGVDRQAPSLPSNLTSRINHLAILGAFALGFFLANLDDSTQQVGSRRFLAAQRFDLTKTRDVHVNTMCRCGSNALPVPGRPSPVGFGTGIIQPPSKATGMDHSKRFILHHSDDGQGCTCIDDSIHAASTSDMFLNGLNRKCPESSMKHPSNYDWNELPDLGVEQALPLFVGVLSYKSPLSLNGTLHNWLDNDFFRRANAQDVFVQLNKKSELDDEVLDNFQERLIQNEQPPVNVMGSEEENLHPGLAISKFCRAAEAHPSSHPNGENLLMFLEKDWHLHEEGIQVQRIEEIFHSINSLAQRGVHYMRLGPPVNGVNDANSRMWKCPSEGVAWECTNAHQHRWTNTPLVLDCSWFLRYLEPFALLDDPIMYGCREGFQDNRYCDWEEALQDGRVAWTDAQWVVANLRGPKPKLFIHEEVDL